MKNLLKSLLVIGTFCLVAWGQSAQSLPRIVGRGPHHRVWQWTANDGTTNTYVEIKNGVNYQAQGQWVETLEEIQITPNGAQALRGQHQVRFPANLNAGLLEMVSADGKIFDSQPRSLGYYDAASGKGVVIGQLKDSVGQLVAKNQLVYPDAFTGVKADVRYTYRMSGLEQDIILRQNPPSPAQWGLNEATTRLVVMTEFFNPPQPRVEQRMLYIEADPAKRGAMVSPDFEDQFLDFGWMVMPNGKAFGLSAQGIAQDISAPVGKL